MIKKNTCIINYKSNTNSEINIILSWKCNLRCQFCPRQSDSFNVKDLLIDSIGFKKLMLYLDLFRQYNENNINIHITGGEPLLIGEKVKKIIEFCEKYNVTFSISTNLTVELKNNFIYDIQRKALFKHFNISFLTLNTEVFKTITKTKTNKYFDSFMKNLKLLDKDKTHRFQITVCDNNIAEVEKIIDYILNLSNKYIIKIVPVTHLKLNIDERNKNISKKTEEKLIDIKNNNYPSNVIFFRLNLGLTVPLRDCILQENRVAINSDGNLLLCPYIYRESYYNLNNISKNNFNDIISLAINLKNTIDDNRKSLEHCSLKSQCGFGCKGIADEAKEVYHNYDPLCCKNNID